MADPHEGLDREGFITTGAQPANVRAPFSAVIDDAAASCAAVTDFHSLYVYGSVSTGMARIGYSDLDLLRWRKPTHVPDWTGLRRRSAGSTATSCAR